MALVELIPLEDVICENSKVNLKTTYTIINMKLTKLFEEVIPKVEKGILPILEMRILVHTLKDVVFSDEMVGNRFLFELCKCLHQNDQWSYETILIILKIIRDLITHNLIINGSLINYMDEKIDWDLDPPICEPLENG